MQPTQKVALITGANKGIGFEVARQLGKAGQTVLLGARNAELGEAATAKLKGEGIDARFVALDLGNAETISAAAAFVEKEFGRLDVLVNNAGIVDLKDGLPSKADIAGMKRVMDTNFFDTLAVTQAFLELVKKSDAGRIVNVSSGLGSLTLHGDPAWKFASVKVLGYCASKAALNMMTVQLAYELRDTNIKVNAADPGYTATDLNGNSGYQTIEEGAAETVRLALLPEDGVSGTFSNSEGIEPW
jgi:NAD(P)-dependent dehydrogenase (short-subunit alcohol dehydrogenase family)